jgi:hypothetical protein
MIIKTKNLFENIVSSFLIFDDPQECYSDVLCTDSVFLIIDDNYKEMSIATFQTLDNIKQIYRYNQSETKNEILVRLIYDLIYHYNKLANECENNNDLDNAKDIRSKVCELLELIVRL